MKIDMEELLRDACLGNIYTVKQAIAIGLNINEPEEKFGITPLLSAIANENEEMVQFLLQNGASPDLANPLTGETPLLCAIERNNEQITRLLLREGCDLYTRNHQGQTAFDIASPERLAQLKRAVLRRQKVQKDAKPSRQILGFLYCLGYEIKESIQTKRIRKNKILFDNMHDCSDRIY